jgi:N utilization substance protein A
MESGGPSRIEMLAVADAVAREKGIEREEVITAMEQAIQKAGRSKYGPEHDIRAVIDREGGHISLARYREVVEEIEDEHIQLTRPGPKSRMPRLASFWWMSFRRSISGV